MTLRDVGQKMGGSDYAAVGMDLKRFEQRLIGNRALMKYYKQLSTLLDAESRA
jgi:hypothetical protein